VRFPQLPPHREPGCAVLAAIESGALTDERVGSYRKLERERASSSAGRMIVGAGREAEVEADP
jgi:ribosome biogenesis GTPase